MYYIFCYKEEYLFKVRQLQKDDNWCSWSSMHWISENVIINAPVYAYWFPHLLTLLAPHLFSYKLQNCSKYFQKHLELSSVLKWAYTFIIKIHFKILFKEQKLLTLPPKNNVFHDVWYLMDLTGPVSWLIQR